MLRSLGAGCAATIFVAAASSFAIAQTSQLPEIIVQGAQAAPSGTPATSSASPSLTQPGLQEAQREISRVPGGAEVVAAEDYRSTPSVTMKDMLDYVPGVWIQPKWGEDSRISIRGSSLSRNFHGRSIQLYMDGIPINTADGYFDFQEIDPTAYRYVEVFKGANALRFGANSLGGAINFVTPSGRTDPGFASSADIGSFGFHRLQASIGKASAQWDAFITGSWQEQDGFRDHSWGESTRGSANIGYRFTPNIETRWYFNANDIDQRIPGAVSKQAALTTPKVAAPNNVAFDWQRNIDSYRLANKTTMKLDNGLVEFGVFGVNRHLMHPIFQWLDHHHNDYGAFVRSVDERRIGGYLNRLVVGANLHNGALDDKRYDNMTGPAVKGPLLWHTRDKSTNASAYFENSFYARPDLALIAGGQYLFAVRDREAIVGTTSGKSDFSLFSPKIGFVWDADPGAQLFGNISRSAEVPSFGESAAGIPFELIKAQRATTYEIGTRGRRADYTWDISLYRANIQNELMCYFSAFGNCNVTNADKTIHQGVELGYGFTLAKGMFANGLTPDRLWLNLAYTFSDFRFDNDPTFGNNELPGAPRHYIRAEVLYKHPNGFFFGPNTEIVPQAYFIDSANTMETASYVLWGLRAGFEAGNFAAYVEGRNLADRKYISSAQVTDTFNPAFPNQFEPGTGRAFYAGVRNKW